MNRVRPGLATAGLGLAIACLTLFGRSSAPAAAVSSTLVTLTGVLAPANHEWGTERAFVVPAGTTAIDIDLVCATGESQELLGFGVGGPAGLRGWSTARHDHVHIDALSASFGYLPGAIEAGEWHILLGASPMDDEAETSYRVTVRLSSGLDRAWPTLRSSPGWFAGDLHVHSAHSDGYHGDAEGRQWPVLVGDLATRAAARHLDFLAVTDHNTASHWVDVDRVQTANPNLLLLHGREITTARGHFNAIGERRFTDFRLGPGRPLARLLRDVARDGAFLSINHAWLSSDQWCRGCGWMDRDAATMENVAGIEVLNGSTPTVQGDAPGWTFWADRLNRGEHVVPVGGSDLHDPIEGRASLGQPATVVWAAALSEQAIVAGLQAGRVFVRAGGEPGSFVELTAASDLTTVTMGQTIAAGRLRLTAHVKGSARQRCLWIRRGHIVSSVDVGSDEQTVTLAADAQPGDWFSVVISHAGQPRLISNAVFVR